MLLLFFFLFFSLFFAGAGPYLVLILLSEMTSFVAQCRVSAWILHYISYRVHNAGKGICPCHRLLFSFRGSTLLHLNQS